MRYFLAGARNLALSLLKAGTFFVTSMLAALLFWGALVTVPAALFYADWGMLWWPNLPELFRGLAAVAVFSTVLVMSAKFSSAN